LPIEGETSLTTTALADSLGASSRGIRVLVEPLVAIKLLICNSEKEVSLSRKFAVYLHDGVFLERLRQTAQWWYPCEQLAAAIRTGRPVSYEGESWDLLEWLSSIFTIDPAIAVLSEPAEEVFDRVARGFVRTRVLIVAAELGILDRVSMAHTALSELITSSAASPEGLQTLLQALVRMNILRTDGTSFWYNPDVLEVLGERPLPYYKQSLRFIELQWKDLSHLDDAVLHDRRSPALQHPDRSHEFYLALARYNTAHFAPNFLLARRIPKTLCFDQGSRSATVLDVGAGAGAWGIAFAHANPHSMVTFLDLPQVLPQTRRNVDRLNLSSQSRFVAGDLLHAEYGVMAYDVIILGLICHTQAFQDLPRLLDRLVRALKPDGYLVIADWILNEQRDGPLNYLYFGVKEYVSTGGSVLSLAEYNELLAGAGLGSTCCYRLDGIDIMLANQGGCALPEMIQP
jgi:SAM-dependent methyltransferase